MSRTSHRHGWSLEMERECLAFMRKHLFKKERLKVTDLVARSKNLTISGNNHVKEAQGLQLIQREISRDGRLMLHKSFEKATADFCVHPPGAPQLALGVQLKTTGVFWKQASTGNHYFSFRETNGYAGMLMVFVAVHIEPPRVWFADGGKVLSKGVQIPVIQRQPSRTARLQEIAIDGVAEALLQVSVQPCMASTT